MDGKIERGWPLWSGRLSRNPVHAAHCCVNLGKLFIHPSDLSGHFCKMGRW